MTDAADLPGFWARGGAWVLAQSALLITLIALGVLCPGTGHRPLIPAVGLLLFALGGSVGIAGVATLGRNRTPYPQPRADSELVQRGIYNHIRHPLYTSVMVAAFGWALLWQSAAALGLATLLVPFFWAKARQEERRLRHHFPNYAAYEHRVPRFIPRWPSSLRRN